MEITVVLGFCTLFGAVKMHPLNNEYEKVVSACKELCSNCGGEGRLKEDVCLCLVPQSGETKESCLSSAKERAKALDLGWKAEIIPNPELSTQEHKNHRVKRGPKTEKRESKGSVDNTQQGYAPPSYNPSGFPSYSYPYQTYPYQPEQAPAETMTTYEIALGKNGENKVQLMFPQSEGIEVKHEYVYETPSGEEYTCFKSHSEEGQEEDEEEPLEPDQTQINKKPKEDVARQNKNQSPYYQPSSWKDGKEEIVEDGYEDYSDGTNLSAESAQPWNQWGTDDTALSNRS